MGALAAASTAVVGLGEFMVDAVSSAMEMQDAQILLEGVLKNTSQTTGVTANMVEGLAGKYSNLTKFSDDAIVSAGGIMAKYKTISSDTFPGAMKASMDLATSMGTDLPSAAQMLGKILDVPGQALARLKMAGVEVDESFKKQIKTLTDAGDTAGAQKMIIDALNGSIGGLAEAAGTTASGQIAILGNVFDQIKEKIGTGLLPIIGDLTKKFTEWLGSPAVQGGIQDLAAGIADFAQQAVTFIPQVIDWFQQVVSFFQNNQGVVVGILAALGVAVAAFAITTAISMAPVIGAMLPVIAIMVLIGVAAYLLYEAWKNDWGGIREKAQAVWDWLQPMFNQLKEWLATNIPIAIQALKTFWSDVLWPAIKAVWDWIATTIPPIVAKIVAWLQVEIPAAISTLQGWWNALLPVVQQVWAGIQTGINLAFVFIQQIFQVFKDAFSGNWHQFGVDLRTVWDNLWATIKAILGTAWIDLQVKVGEIVTGIINFFKTTDWGKVGSDIVQGIANGITSAADWIMKAVEAVGGAAIAAIKGFLGIASPSTVFAGIGQNMMQGMAQGIDRNTDLPVMAAVGAASQVTNATSETNIYVTPHYYRGDEPTMTEEVNMLAMRYGAAR